MSYLSPVDNTELLEVVNKDGDTVYRDQGTGVEYTKEYLESIDAKQVDANGGEKSLADMKRGELDEVAKAEGLDPKSYKNADEVRAAIEAKRAGSSES